MSESPVVETKAVTLSELRKPTDNLPVVRMGLETNQSFELMQRIAKMFAQSELVPAQFRGNIGNCVIALNMANRTGADPLQVMQNLYVVHGKPGWSAKYLIATFNRCGRFTPIQYEWQGSEGKDDWGCRAFAKDRESGQMVYGPWITIAMAKKEGWYEKSGSKWKTIPGLMLPYRAAAWLTNTVAPEVSMGFSTAEELHDIYEAEKGDDGVYAVTQDSLRATADAHKDKPARKSRKPADAVEVPDATIAPAKADPPAATTGICANPVCKKEFDLDDGDYNSPEGPCCSLACAEFMASDGGGQ